MKISVLTLGCKVNKYESDALAYKLKERGFVVNDLLDWADAYIINTCAVTAEAEKKSRQMIARCRKFNKEAKIYICGCASQNNSKQFLDKDVEVVVGTSGKLKLIDYLENLEKNDKKINKNIENIEILPQIYQDDLKSEQTRTRAYIKIQDGCNNFCAYCIIPYLRGRSRSRPFDSIIDEAKNLPSEVKEIVLTGINVSDYKIDGENGLLRLLTALDKLGKRIRLGSLEDTLIEKDFAQGLSKLKNFCPHFHLSLQSGSDSVLKRMNRHYTAEQFKQSVQMLRKYFPQAGITTDVIVGFCDESEQEFEETYQFLKDLKFSQLHIFKYSNREGTMASKIYSDLPFAIKQSRLERLEKLNNELKDDFINLISEGKVLFEEKVEGYFAGYSENYIKCYCISDQEETNQIKKVKFLKKFKDGALVEIIK